MRDPVEAQPYVTLEQVNALVAEFLPAKQAAPVADGKVVPIRTPTQLRPGGDFDLEAWVRRHQLQVVKEGPWKGSGYRWILAVCPFNPEHTDKSAWVARQESGATSAGCSHNSCSWTWEHLREKLDGARPSGAVAAPEVIPALDLGAPVESFKGAPGYVDDDDQEPDPDALGQMLDRYVALGGSTSAWDSRNREVVMKGAIEFAHPKEYRRWLKHPARTIVPLKDLVFAPQGAKPGQINMFRGFVRTPDPAASCERMVAHLLMLCGFRQNLAHWLTCWLAYPLQHPGAKLRTAVVMHGAQGTGKNALFEAVMRIYGEYGYIMGQAQLETRFNGWLSAKLFVVADEVVSRADLRFLKNKLKGLITGEFVTIEEKNLPCRMESNHANWVFLSNEDVPVIVDADDRRFFVIKCDDKERPDYFRTLFRELNEEGGLDAFYHYLLTYDTAEFSPFDPPPDTEERNEMIDACLEPQERFLRAWLGDELCFPIGTVKCSDLFEAYKVWAKVTNIPRAGEQTAFGRAAGKVLERQMLKIFNTSTRAYTPKDRQTSVLHIEEFRQALDVYLRNYQDRKL